MKKSASLLAASMVLVSAAAAPASVLTNGGFETGDLTGWTASPNVLVLEQHFIGGITPNDGDFMAVLSPLGVLDADLEQTFGVSSITDPTVSFAWNLQALDFSHFFDFGTDSLTVSIGGIELLNVSLNDVFGGGTTVQGWNTFSRTIPGTFGGAFMIDFDVENVLPGDAGQKLYAYVDDVSIAGVVPEPLNVAIWGLLGVVGLVGLKWQNRRQA